jgi:hypothetical protein
VLLAGDETKGHSAGTKTGDLMHAFTGGSIQIITDATIDPAGNVWVANNWNDIEAATAENRHTAYQAAFHAPSGAIAPQAKPNILVIMGDDIGHWNISAYNAARWVTAHRISTHRQ